MVLLINFCLIEITGNLLIISLFNQNISFGHFNIDYWPSIWHTCSCIVFFVWFVRLSTYAKKKLQWLMHAKFVMRFAYLIKMHPTRFWNKRLPQINTFTHQEREKDTHTQQRIRYLQVKIGSNRMHKMKCVYTFIKWKRSKSTYGVCSMKSISSCGHE